MTEIPASPEVSAGTLNRAMEQMSSEAQRERTPNTERSGVLAEFKGPLCFGLRLVLVFAVLIIPWPYLADSYITGFGHTANAVLWATDTGARIGYRFEPPDEIRANGSWEAILRVEDRQLAQAARMRIGVRTFSYRPVATFAALLMAARLKGWRKNAFVGVTGLALVVLATFALTVLATLRFGLARVLGMHQEQLIETAYESLTTPALLYALPVLVFALLAAIANRNRLFSTEAANG